MRFDFSWSFSQFNFLKVQFFISTLSSFGRQIIDMLLYEVLETLIMRNQKN